MSEILPSARYALPVLQTQIRGCTKCVEAGYIPEALPLTVGDWDAPFMVIGQAPSRTAYETRTFYRGPAGEKLQSWFVQAGFDEGDFGTRVYLAAITKCFPGRLPGSSKDRLPSRAEQALCRPWLNNELDLLRPRVIVLFGGLAINTFLSRDPLDTLVGQAFEKDGRTYLPFPHSSGASTWLNSQANRALLQSAIERLREARAANLAAVNRNSVTVQANQREPETPAASAETDRLAYSETDVNADEDAPDFTRDALNGVRDGLRSAKFWRELLTDTDRQTMLLDIARISLLTAGDLQDTKPYLDGDIPAAVDPAQTGAAPCPLERLAFLQTAWPRLETALVHIEANPPAVLQSETRWTETEKARRVRPKDVLLALRTGGANGLVPAPNAIAAVPLARRLNGNLPRKLPETVSVSRTDTPVNRATKAVIARLVSDLKTIAQRAQEAGLPNAAREAERLQSRVRRQLMAPLWRDLPAPRAGLSPPVLRRQLLPPSLRASWPHRRIHDTFRDYTDRFALNWEQPLFVLPAQKTWLLYEIWCVFAFAGLLRELGFRPKNEDNWIAFGPHGLSSRLATDRASRLVFVHRETGQTATLTYNRYFGRGDETGAAGWHSRGRALRPDIALEAGAEILVLDAKWKTYREPGWEGDDIRQMHSYRDAIAFGPSRNVVPSAWLLYPGAVLPETRRPVIAYPAATLTAPFGNREVGALGLRPGTELTNSPLARLVSDFLARQKQIF